MGVVRHLPFQRFDTLDIEGMNLTLAHIQIHGQTWFEIEGGGCHSTFIVHSQLEQLIRLINFSPVLGRELIFRIDGHGR